jgi:hypothetical protein
MPTPAKSGGFDQDIWNGQFIEESRVAHRQRVTGNCNHSRQSPEHLFPIETGSPSRYGIKNQDQSTQRRGISFCTLCPGVNAVSNGKTAVFKLTDYGTVL